MALPTTTERILQVTDGPYDDHYDDHDHTEGVVTTAFIKHMVKIVAMFMLKLLFFLVLALGLRVFAVISLWHVPVWAIGFVTALLIADVSWRVTRGVRKTRERRRLKTERAHLTAERRYALEQADEKTRLAKFEHDRRLRNRLRRPTWWANQAIVLTYTACFGLVLTHWTLNAVIGVSVAAGVLAVGKILRTLLDRMMPNMTAMSAFLEAPGRPDSPEI